jgi:hypothetical protein
MLPPEGSHVCARQLCYYTHNIPFMQCGVFLYRQTLIINGHLHNKIVLSVHEPSGGSIFLPILRVPSVNFQNLPPVKKIKYQKILTYILRSIFLEISHLELLRRGKTLRDTNGNGECHI